MWMLVRVNSTKRDIPPPAAFNPWQSQQKTRVSKAEFFDELKQLSKQRRHRG